MVKTDNFKKAIEAINASKSVLVTAHARPDGDAAGCVAAICELLRSTGKNAIPLWLTPLPKWYDFLFTEKVPVLGVDIEKEALNAEPFAGCDLVFIIDTDSFQQLAPIAKWLKGCGKKILVVDHHITGDRIGSVGVTDASAAAAGVLIYELLQSGGWKLTPTMANALFTAVSTDTGWFRFSNVDGRTLRIAAELVEAGARPAELYRKLYQNYSAARMRLMVQLMSTLRLELDGRLAIGYIRNGDFAATGASRPDTDSLIDEFQRIDSVEAVLMLCEQEDGSYRVSMRSRGLVDVAQIAERHNGGGHRAAAGATMKMPLEDGIKTLMAAVAQQM
jgi:bifunctional oligoribonuclease and PAP phosphatase NrnA